MELGWEDNSASSRSSRIFPQGFPQEVDGALKPGFSRAYICLAMLKMEENSKKLHLLMY
jgi:hypothetical protein